MIKFSKLTFLVASFIVISASFMRQVLDFLRSSIGKMGVSVLLASTQIIIGFYFFLAKKKLTWLRLIMIFIVFVLGMLLVWKIKLIAERVHILEYGLLGYLIGRDLKLTRHKFKNIFLACLFTAFVGIIDESFQAVLPYRYFDARDIVFNILGGIWGILLYIF
jgi:hypothetical protein